MARTIALMVPDLMMRTKLSAMVTACGLSPWYARSVEKLDNSSGEHPVDGSVRQIVGIVVDLNAHRENLGSLAVFLRSGAAGQSLGFFSHVTGDVGDEGRDSGCDTVIPRSKLESVMPRFLGGVCEDGHADGGVRDTQGAAEQS
jgi:hypothetical protein